MIFKQTEDSVELDRLGSFYSGDKTVFRAYAPEYERLFLVLEGNMYAMEKDGPYHELTIKGDLEKDRYHFANERGLTFRDPFSYLSIDRDSIVLNKERFEKRAVKTEVPQDVIIYEASVRDFSADPSFPWQQKKFLSLAKEGLRKDDYYMLGLDYLANIGITYLQLLPVFDFDNDRSEYNWGYNPVAYNYVKQDYVIDQDDPYAYVNELRRTVNILHERGIRVVLDVVFNHVYRAFDCDLERMLPHRAIRRKADGELANGSFCGNEVCSEDPFIREYIAMMVCRYIELFDIDGIRMDLMGLTDIATVKLIKERAGKLKKGFLVYGEGWNLGDVLPEKERAAIINYRKLDKVGMFNDFFRETIIGYVCGGDNTDDVCKALKADESYLDSEHSINYVECHDGFTMFDRMNRYKPDDPRWMNEARCRLAMAMVMVAKGAPFIHMGQEFLRTKNGIENSYNKGDAINAIDWTRRCRYNEYCDMLKNLIAIRKAYPQFRKKKTKIRFDSHEGCLFYHLDDLLIIINPTDEDHVFKADREYEIIFDGMSGCRDISDKIAVSALSMVICHS